MSSFMLRMATRAVETDSHVGHTPAPVPRVGLVVNAFLSMITIAVLAICLCESSFYNSKDWSLIHPSSTSNITNTRLADSSTDKMAYVLLPPMASTLADKLVPSNLCNLY